MLVRPSGSIRFSPATETRIPSRVRRRRPASIGRRQIVSGRDLSRVPSQGNRRTCIRWGGVSAVYPIRREIGSGSIQRATWSRQSRHCSLPAVLVSASAAQPIPPSRSRPVTTGPAAPIPAGTAIGVVGASPGYGFAAGQERKATNVSGANSSRSGARGVASNCTFCQRTAKQAPQTPLSPLASRASNDFHLTGRWARGIHATRSGGQLGAVVRAIGSK